MSAEDRGEVQAGADRAPGLEEVPDLLQAMSCLHGEAHRSTTSSESSGGRQRIGGIGTGRRQGVITDGPGSSSGRRRKHGAVKRRGQSLASPEHLASRPGAGGPNAPFVTPWPRHEHPQVLPERRAADGGGLTPSPPEEFCRLFRRGWVDVEPAPPLEAGHAGELWQQLEVPVVKAPVGLAQRGVMDHEIVRGIRQDLLLPEQQFPDDSGQADVLVLLRVLRRRIMALGRTQVSKGNRAA